MRWPCLRGALAALLMLCVSDVSAAPGMLAQSPVLATASAKPNIMLVLDDSGSMGWGSSPVPMTQAKNAAKLLVDTLSNVNVGVGSFYSGGAEVNHAIVDVDKNRASIKKAINKLNAGGGTPLRQPTEAAYRVHRRLGQCIRIPGDPVPRPLAVEVRLVRQSLFGPIRLPFRLGLVRRIDKQSQLGIDNPFGRLVLVKRFPCRLVLNALPLCLRTQSLCLHDQHSHRQQNNDCRSIHCLSLIHI